MFYSIEVRYGTTCFENSILAVEHLEISVFESEFWGESWDSNFFYSFKTVWANTFIRKVYAFIYLNLNAFTYKDKPLMADFEPHQFEDSGLI